MRGLNKTLLIGNLGMDPEIVHLEGGMKIAKFSLATTESFRDDKGIVHAHTEWHTVILWKSLAEIAEKYLHKGSTIYMEGKNKTRSYEDKNGQKRYVTEIIGEMILLMDKKAK